MTRNLSIVIPVYNEAGNIRNVFNQISSKIDSGINKEVLVVYDFDEDTTLPVVRSIEKLYAFKISLVRNLYGRGALNAIKTGLKSSNYDAVLVIMGDLSDDLSTVNDMLRLFDNGYDVVCGSRYMRGGRQIGGPLIKKTISRIAGLTLKLITGIPTFDVTNSFKLYRKSLLDAVIIESNGGFEIGMELAIKAHFMGYKVSEVPSVWTDRAAGESRFQLVKWLPKYLKWYFFAVKQRALKLF